MWAALQHPRHTARGLDNGEAQAVEGAALFGLVRFVAGGVAIADAEEASRAGEVEADGVGRDGDGAALGILRTIPITNFRMTNGWLCGMT